jgi:hypothetical protein
MQVNYTCALKYDFHYTDPHYTHTIQWYHMKISYTKFTPISKAVWILQAVKYDCEWVNLY